MNRIVACLPGIALAVLLYAQGPVKKPTIRVAKDGFPFGQTTPEGAAADLARAFITCDSALFNKVCLPPYGPATYPKYVKRVSEMLVKRAKEKPTDRMWPKELFKVYAARRVSKDGPNAYAKVVLNFKDIKFVDVKVHLRNGQEFLNRTIVIQDAKGTWFAHPAPIISPLLCAGLDREHPSKTSFEKMYDVQR